MWDTKPYADLEKRLRKLLKRHRQEVQNALANLQSYLDALRLGLTPQKIIRGWIHAEPKGIKALDETGPRNPRKAIRLYVYPEEDAQILHVLTIGVKDTQPEDIAHCEHFVDELLEQKQNATPQPPKIPQDAPDDQANEQPGG